MIGSDRVALAPNSGDDVTEDGDTPEKLTVDEPVAFAKTDGGVVCIETPRDCAAGGENVRDANAGATFAARTVGSRPAQDNRSMS